MSDALGINGAIQRASVQQQAAQSASLHGPPAAVQQALVGLPGLIRVPVPARGPDEPLVRPRKAPNTMVPPREQGGGDSPLSTASTADTRDGAAALGGQAEAEERGAQQGKVSAGKLPSAAGLIAYGRTSTGAMVYLEADRWFNHIRPAHITNPPQARGKTTTTWWPVEHSATGSRSA